MDEQRTSSHCKTWLQKIVLEVRRSSFGDLQTCTFRSSSAHVMATVASHACMKAASSVQGEAGQRDLAILHVAER